VVVAGRHQHRHADNRNQNDLNAYRMTLRSYISTAIKHNVNIMTALRQAITGNPWTPTVPATT
jgi:transposase